MTSTDLTRKAVTAAVDTGTARPTARAAGDDRPRQRTRGIHDEIRERLREWDIARLIAAGVTKHAAEDVADTIGQFLAPDTGPVAREAKGDRAVRTLKAYAHLSEISDLIGMVRAEMGDVGDAAAAALLAGVTHRSSLGLRPSHAVRDGDYGGRTAPVDLGQLTHDPRVQPHDGPGEQTVQDAAGAVALGTESPPVTVAGTPILAEEAHRAEAARTPGHGDAGEVTEGAAPADRTHHKSPGQQSSHPAHSGDGDGHAELVELVRIICDPRVQPRERLDEQTVQDYADAMKDGDMFPAVTAFGDLAAGDLILADGAHRVEAARRAGLTSIRAEIHDGTIWDAMRYALKANSLHGLRRSRKDIAKAIKMAYEHRAALGLPDVPSTRIVADLVGCDHKTADIELGKFPSWAKATARTGADGKARAVRPPKPPRAKAAPPSPQASPAESTGVVPTTPVSPVPAPPMPERIAPEEQEQQAAPTPTDDTVVPAPPASVGPVDGDEQQQDPDGLGALVPEACANIARWPVFEDPTGDDVLRMVVEELVQDGSAQATSFLTTIGGKLRYRYPAFFERLRELFDRAASGGIRVGA